VKFQAFNPFADRDQKACALFSDLTASCNLLVCTLPSSAMSFLQTAVVTALQHPMMSVAGLSSELAKSNAIASLRIRMVYRHTSVVKRPRTTLTSFIAYNRPISLLETEVLTARSSGRGGASTFAFIVGQSHLSFTSHAMDMVHDTPTPSTEYAWVILN
jgi:hypothetical protein